MPLPRVMTGVVGVPLLLAAIYFGSLPFFFVILAIVLLGLREFFALAQETGYSCDPLVGTVLGGLLTVSVFLNGLGFASLTENQLTASVLSVAIVLVITKSLWKGPADTTLSDWSVTLFGILYVAWTLSHLLLLRDFRPRGEWVTLFLFVTIWGSDIMAYVVGKRWGRRLIAESISPKKTWEGTIAGALCGVVVGSVFHFTPLKPVLSVQEGMMVGLVVSILGFFSDLGESMLKRGAGAKDSSQLLPGHGGILDRFDSFLLAAPVYYYYWAFLKH